MFEVPLTALRILNVGSHSSQQGPPPRISSRPFHWKPETLTWSPALREPSQFCKACCEVMVLTAFHCSTGCLTSAQACSNGVPSLGGSGSGGIGVGDGGLSLTIV